MNKKMPLRAGGSNGDDAGFVDPRRLVTLATYPALKPASYKEIARNGGPYVPAHNQGYFAVRRPEHISDLACPGSMEPAATVRTSMPAGDNTKMNQRDRSPDPAQPLTSRKKTHLNREAYGAEDSQHEML